jgi:hypothetical protein
LDLSQVTGPPSRHPPNLETLEEEGAADFSSAYCELAALDFYF